ncbi:MAG TPA: hypothetical protein DIT10_24510 [Chryseobacterium sp.]|nr:hypothetical protein [Chryseobacterium sp.]
MWIKEKPTHLLESGRAKANFLYNKDKVYVMDNHLCATWCWLQKADRKKTYDFVHIDRHNDLLFPSPSIKADLLKNNIDLCKITFEEYLNLNENDPEEHNIKVKLFRWDNYILNLEEVYPDFFGTKYFITKEAYPDSEFIDFEFRIEEFIKNFDRWLIDSKDGWIINLDIDFFYSEHKGIYKIYSDELIKKIATILMENMDKIDAITIALSPECCGGWENAFETMKIFNDIMELDMQI